MVLIKCPECGKEISNLSKRCIHCGFPLDKNDININNDFGNTVCTINNITYDFSDFLNLYKCGAYLKAIDYLNKNYNFENKDINLFFLLYFDKNRSIPRAINNFDLQSISNLSDNEKFITIHNIIKKFQLEEKQQILQNKSCPKCGCTEFTPIRRKFSLLTGFATNKIDIVCNKCGTKI